MPPRPYQLGKRAQTSAETRSRIIACAAELFSTIGYQRVSMEAVAEKADVGRTTVFEQFGSKIGLFQAVEQELRQRAFTQQFEAAPACNDPQSKAAAVVRNGCEAWAANQGMYEALQGMALLEPEYRQDSNGDAVRRLERIRSVAHELVAAGRVRSGVTEADVADALSLVASFCAFSHLRTLRPDSGSVSGLLELLLRGLLTPAKS